MQDAWHFLLAITERPQSGFDELLEILTHWPSLGRNTKLMPAAAVPRLHSWPHEAFDGNLRLQGKRQQSLSLSSNGGWGSKGSRISSTHVHDVSKFCRKLDPPLRTQEGLRSHIFRRLKMLRVRACGYSEQTR